jgi:death-on-curing protein
MKATPENCFHLTVAIVREIHSEAIGKFGGSAGVRELALLESAVAAPQASIGGRSPYQDIAEMAAAYLFYLCKNHPFLDGNKRTALGACLVFLRLNGIDPEADGLEWEELTLAVAESAIDRAETTRRLRKLLPKKPEQSHGPRPKPLPNRP